METVTTTQQPKQPMYQPCSPANSSAALPWRPGTDKRPLNLLAGIVSYRSAPGLSD